VSAPALKVDGLVVDVTRDRERFRAVDGVSLAVELGKSIGLVGESGCGKSLTLRAVMGLLPERAAAAGGRVTAAGVELPLAGKGVAAARRGRLGMIFQDPGTALDPVMTCGYQIAEAPRRVLGMSRAKADTRALELLRLVGIPDAERRMRSYPHELSGGTRQRVMIAIALSSEPKVLLCDEPTTALDVTIQAQILRLLVDLQEEMGLSIVFVTHELALVGELCRDVCVMYAGRLVETGRTADVLARPLHPYTIGLLRSAVDLDVDVSAPVPIPGSLPDPLNRPGGCAFHPRCFLARPGCETAEVSLASAGEGRASACLYVDELLKGGLEAGVP
jgi:oligopeptide/dipeptide ABC transporter ATP-binding protein